MKHETQQDQLFINLFAGCWVALRLTQPTLLTGLWTKEDRLVYLLQ